MTTLINIKSEKMTIGNSVINVRTEHAGIIADIYLTDRGYAVKLQDGSFDYAHRYIISNK